MKAQPTYAACLTPPGSGAIATIAMHGPEALRIGERLFRARRSKLAEVGSIALGKFGAETADEVVLIVKQTEPVPQVELHCHGGREVVRMILETLHEQGVQTCSWQELERLTAPRPALAEATILLAQARTVRTAAILLDQVAGAFERAIAGILSALQAQDDETASRLLEELAARVPVGRHLTEPWRVVVAGAPNVGKSSLVNALAGFQRSIVAPVPGTTRDVVTAAIAIDGWPIELSDTAGLRDQAEALEEQGIRLAQSAIASADLCLWVLDGSVAPTAERLSDSARIVPIINKVDLPAAWDFERVPGALPLSARTGAGLAELCQALADRLVPRPPPPGAAVPFTLELCAQIEKAQRAWAAGDRFAAQRLAEAVPLPPKPAPRT